MEVDRNTTNMAVEMPELQLLNLGLEKLEPLRKEIGSDSRIREIEAEIITSNEVRKEDQGNRDLMSMDG